MKCLPAVAMLALLAPSSAWSQANPSPQAKIQNAMSAAPPTLAARATILDWPATEGGAPAQLRPGTNGWVCYPDMPMTEGNDPICLDAGWQSFLKAYMTRQTPTIDRLSVGYMLAPGGGWGSNVDPFARERTADNEWGHDPPHLMIAVPDPRMLEGIPTTRDSGGPWVMWRGTPYAHIMVPLEPGKR